MNRQIAINILVESISRLEKKRGELYISDIEAEVINNACLFYLKNNQKYDFNHAFLIAVAFTEAAEQLFPGQYGDAETSAAQIQIPTNLKWDGMWDFLRKYFLENHHIQIDSVELKTKDFNSDRHERYEFGNLVSHESVERLVSVDFLDNDDVMVRISPTLSPKKAYLILSNDNIKQYKSYDETYLFTVELDFMEEIEKFTLDIPSRQLRIQYY